MDCECNRNEQERGCKEGKQCTSASEKEQSMSDWIRLADRQPELIGAPLYQSTRVLVYNERNNDLLVAKLCWGSGVYFWTSRQVGSLSYKYVTHWMPIAKTPGIKP